MKRNPPFFYSFLDSKVRLQTTDLKGVLSKLYWLETSTFKQRVVCSSGENGPKAVDLYNVCDPTGSGYWYTNHTMTYYQVYIKTLPILISSYKLESEDKGNEAAHLKTWVLSGSINGNEWDPIHEQKDYKGLIGPSIIKEFRVNATKKYSYFRLTQTGPSNSPTEPNRMSLQKIDFYEKQCLKNTYLNYPTRNSNIIYYLAIFLLL